MMLGWGLRGFIGGGPLGAMIPGAMVVLTLCLLYPRRDVATLAAFGAIGVGIVGDETYGQTIGFIVKAETFWWGLLGLSLKGAIWGAVGGGVIGLGLTALSISKPTRLVLGAVVVMAAATEIGWKLINEPKLIYFSNRLDKPRAEIWAGFALAAIALVAYLAWQGHAQPALRFALVGFVGGAIGFGGGGAIQGLGKIFAPDLNLHWWKYMEFFFGLLFGWALALAMAWTMARSKPSEEPNETETERARPLWMELLAAVAINSAMYWLERKIPLRFTFLVVGGLMLVLVTQWRWLSKHLAYSVTFTATVLDLARHWSGAYKRGTPEPAYALAIVAAVVFAYAVYRWSENPQRMLNLLTWGCVAVAIVKFAIQPVGLSGLIDHIAAAFVLMAIAVSWMAPRVDGAVS